MRILRPCSYHTLVPLGRLWLLAWCAAGLLSQSEAAPSRYALSDTNLAAYFRQATDQLTRDTQQRLAKVTEWKKDQAKYRRQLQEMLGLWPYPEKTPLHPVVTGRETMDDFVVEKLHFQSLPGFYVTGNLYLPKPAPKRAPAILYVSGHGPVKRNGISYGNKVTYQHHGIWFARNGYVCLVLDTVQMGEIEGIHHGTYREGMWWWNARGYSSAGAEAWNCIRALDYLETRPEVDPQRFGVTGRSGGGAYSWWIAALDERIQVAAPVAGITDLHNHVVDGTVEGHCDCMFVVNTYRWDYPMVAALVAPRPLLIVNTDSDVIFPLDGVQRIHAAIRPLYEHLEAGSDLGLVIAPGPHKDTQDIRVPVFRWFNRHLKSENPLITLPAEKQLQPAQLKVFATLPSEERTSHIHESLVPKHRRKEVAGDHDTWNALSQAWRENLAATVFGGWPKEARPVRMHQLNQSQSDRWALSVYEFESQAHVPLRIYLLSPIPNPDHEEPRILQCHVFPDPRPLSYWMPQSNPNEPFGFDPEGALAAPVFEQWISWMRVAFEKGLGDEARALGDRAVADAAGYRRFIGSLVREQKTDAGPVPVHHAFIETRGLGLSRWDDSIRKQIQIRRRFMLVGQTLEGMRVWDIRRALQALSSVPGSDGVGRRLEVISAGNQACNALYASLYERNIDRLDLWELPHSHREGPDYLNVLRFLDVPHAVAMALEHSSVRLHRASSPYWQYPIDTLRNLKWPGKTLELR